MRRSYVNWMPASEKLPEMTDRKYLVAKCEKDGSSDILIATFYKKNDKINLRKKDTELKQPETQDEKILQLIGIGCYKQIVIQKTGFYIVTTQDGLGENSDCAEELEMIINLDTNTDSLTLANIFWTELPQPPVGFRHPYDVLYDKQLRAEKYKEETMKKSIDKLEEIISSMPEADAIKDLKIKELETDEPKSDYGMMIKYNKNDVLKICGLIVLMMYTQDYINKTYEDRYIYETFNEARKTGNDSKLVTIVDNIKQFIHSKYDINDTVQLDALRLTIRLLLPIHSINIRDFNYYFQVTDRHDSFYKAYYKRNEGVIDDTALRVVLASALSRTTMRIRRTCKMKELNAPPVILENEFRMIFESMLMIYAEYVEPITKKISKEIYGHTRNNFENIYNTIDYDPEDNDEDNYDDSDEND